jgi:PAS domain S-box-containing protein
LEKLCSGDVGNNPVQLDPAHEELKREGLMAQGAITLNADGAIAYCNRRFADLLGRPHERLTGVAFRDFIPPDEQALTRACCNKAAPAPARVKRICRRRTEGGFKFIIG